MAQRLGTYGLSEADIERVIDELLQDQKIMTSIEKIVNRRLRRNPHGNRAWRQAVVDSTVQEVLQKLRIVDMILEEQETAGYSECWPSFSESEPQPPQPGRHPRRRARALNKAAVEAAGDVPEWVPKGGSQVAEQEDLDRTQVLTVTLPAAVKDLAREDQWNSFHSNRSESSESEEESSPVSSNIVHEERNGRYYNEESERNRNSDYNGVAELRSAEQNMQNDSVQFDSDHSMNASTDTSADNASRSSPGDIFARSENETEEGPHSFEQERDSGDEGFDNQAELSAEEGVATSAADNSGEGSAVASAVNTSAVSEEPEYAEEDWEEPPGETDAKKNVKFVDPVVSDIYLSRYKYDRDQVAEMFYSADDGNKFQMDFDRELDRSMQAEKGWLDWMMERTEEEAQQHEQEDDHYHSYEYELEEEENDGIPEGEYF